MRNCANYGSVTHSWVVSGSFARIGGIVGEFGYPYESSTNNAFIQNCLNYGTITHSGTTGTLYFGGILGYTWDTNIENCVNGGKATVIKAASDTDYIGSIVGSVNSGATVTITHCYWTSDAGNYNACGSGNPTINHETSLISLNTTMADSLNSYNSSWNKWLLNTNNQSVTFIVNNGKGFNLSSQLILLPSLAESENHTFSGWFVDEDCTKEFTGSSVEEDTVLYGCWSYMLTFDPTGGVATLSSKIVVYGQKYGELPSATRTATHSMDGSQKK